MSRVIHIRDASADELELLSDLALRSKGFWGYDEAFLEACRAELTFTTDQLDRDRVRVAEVGDDVVGVAAVARRPGDEAELDDLFVDPGSMGIGVGRALLDDAVAIARKSGARRLRIEADPNAEAWYRARGARPKGTVSSGSIPGRSLPLLVLEIS